MGKAFRILIASLIVGGATLLAGFPLFASTVSRYSPRPGLKADAIVVLTGGEERISAAIRLLADGVGRRLLISGAHPRTGPLDIRRITGFDERYFHCCIDIGHQAVNTIGNADEARDWAETWGFKSLLIVTSSFHMPRSLAEFARALPNVRLIPYPVVSRYYPLETWWHDRSMARLLAAEYLKFLTSAARLGLSRLLAPAERWASKENRRDDRSTI